MLWYHGIAKKKRDLLGDIEIGLFFDVDCSKSLFLVKIVAHYVVAKPLCYFHIGGGLGIFF